MRAFDLASQTETAFQGLSYCVGSGYVHRSETVRLALGPVSASTYANAQLDDYHQTNQFRWRPPLRLTVVARFSGPGSELTGTAGFGFWNDPLGMTGRARLRMPQSVWYFYAGGPSCIPLVLGDPGWGWRAAALNAATFQAGLVVPIAPFLAAAMHFPRLKRFIWGWLQRRLRLTGRGLDGERMGEWHRYDLAWDVDRLHFAVDEREVWRAAVRVDGPLGMVTWIDNQFMVLTPEGRVRHGKTSTNGQWLELETLTIEPQPR